MKLYSLVTLLVLAAAWLAILSPFTAGAGPVPMVGDKAPLIQGQDQDGKTWKLADVVGKQVVLLYFYPKDDTPGCTIEACGLRDSFKEIEKLNTVILGVSPDSAKSHDKFISKYKLPFTLLADEDKKICQDYGVWVEKSMYGKKYMGIERSTVLVDAKGKIAKIWPKVKIEGHAAEVLAAVKAL